MFASRANIVRVTSLPNLKPTPGLFVLAAAALAAIGVGSAGLRVQRHAYVAAAFSSGKSLSIDFQQVSCDWKRLHPIGDGNSIVKTPEAAGPRRTEVSARVPSQPSAP